MYNWIENAIGLVPSGFEWIYGVATIFLFLAFVVLMVSPILLIFNILKNNRRR